MKGKIANRCYGPWSAAIARCYNKNNPGYKHYGGRGIRMCARWLNSFENFVYDMGEPPEKHVLDRIDNDGDYEPANCRWATRRISAENKRTASRLIYNGEIKNISAWARHFKLNPALLHHRLKEGEEVNEHFFRPPIQRGKLPDVSSLIGRLLQANYPESGQPLTCRAIAKILGLSRQSVLNNFPGFRQARQKIIRSRTISHAR